jgi:dienelactone hydrolase
MFPRTELRAEVFGKVERPGYTIEKVVLETFPGFFLSGNLYRPSGKRGKVPAVLCPHGHWAEGRVVEVLQNRAIGWAKLGCVSFIYDMVGYADSKPFGHKFLNDRLRRWGLSLVTLQTWNSIRVVDFLSSLDDVDPARIGCTGESGGGTQTFLLTAIDDRIKVAAPVVMVSDSFQGGCVCENAAGLRIGTDNVEFAALCAPRPMKLVGASGDWTARTMFRAYPQVREVYHLFGAPERVSADVFNFPHNYNQTSRNAVYAFMAKWLLGIDDPDRTREGDQTIEEPEDLYTFTEKHPAPAGRKSAAQLEAELVGVMRRQLDKLAPESSAAAWEAGRQLLLTSLKVRLGLVNPSADDLGAQLIRRTGRPGYTMVHYLVGRRSTGEEIPTVCLIPARANGHATLCFAPTGKAGLFDASGQPTPVVGALLDRGQTVVGFDPFLVGESIDPAAPVHSRPEAFASDCYNPTLPADRAQDLATLVAWTRSQPEILDVSLIALGDCGPLALLARPALEGLARTAIDLNRFDFGDGSGPVPPMVDAPGVLQFGGTHVAAALCCPAPLWIFGAAEGFATKWPVKSYAMADASGLLRIDAQGPDADALARWIDAGERAK